MSENNKKSVPKKQENLIEKPSKDSPNSKPKLDPVRYGDWEKNGRCIDF